MSGCDDHIGAQQEALVTGLRKKGAGNKTDPFWHRWKPHVEAEGSLGEGE